MVLSVVMVVSWLLFVVLFEIGWCLWCFVVGFVCNWVVFVGFCCCHLLLIVVVLLTKAIRTKNTPTTQQSINKPKQRQTEGANNRTEQDNKQRT
jgi:ABC-type protease/lipase transport system fused ATPase/permease subunit